MSDHAATYDFKDGQVTASVDGKVIASGATLDEVEAQVGEILDAPAQVNPKEATHIVNPNGLKGRILSRVASTWGDVYTVRFENNEIQSMYVNNDTQFSVEAEQRTASAGETPVTRLRATIEARAIPSKSGLKARQNDLINVRTAAAKLISSGVSIQDLHELDQIVLQAENEQREIKEALDHIDATEGEGIEPFKPDMQIIPGENIGHQNDGTWLDAMLQDEQAAAESVDFDKLLDDGPTALVAEQEDATLADAGDVRELALSHVQARTAGLAGDKVEQYEGLFVARAEQARRIELARRKQDTRKEAAQKQSRADDAPVESLFM